MPPDPWDIADQERGQTRKPSQATSIVTLATEAGVELWHTPSQDAYLTITIDGHREHHLLHGRAAKDYLAQLYYQDAGKAPNATALADAVNTLSGTARFSGDEHPIHVRVAGDDTRIYLDLCDAAWRVVEVTAYGWQVVTNPPVRFRRANGMQPLPVPEPGGSLDDLRPFVNVANDEEFALVVMWQLAAIRPRGPYPILVSVAEQGASKTTTARVLRRNVDPNDADVRRPPRNTEDLMIAASNGHIVSFDNLSRLSEELSDNLSVLSTGGGFSVRTLYTNREEVIFHAQRPIALNGIAQFASRGDLVDRAIIVTLPTIPEDRRLDEATFWKAYTEARPRILGSLLDAVATGLRNLPTVSLRSTPRMADFALWGVAVEPACPWPTDTFLAAYEANRQGAVEATIDGDPVVEVVQALVEHTPTWDGTATDFLAELNQRTPEQITRRKEWFSKPRQVSDALRRLAPALRRTGIDATFIKVGKARTRLIQISRFTASAPSAGTAVPDSRAQPADEPADEYRPASATSSATSTKSHRGAGEADAADDEIRPFLRDEDDDDHAADDAS